MKKQPNVCFSASKAKRSCLSALAIIVLSFFGKDANAYELNTHARITYQAYAASRLAIDPTLMADLGLNASTPNPFGDRYFDVSGPIVTERIALSFYERYSVIKAFAFTQHSARDRV